MGRKETSYNFDDGSFLLKIHYLFMIVYAPKSQLFLFNLEFSQIWPPSHLLSHTLPLFHSHDPVLHAEFSTIFQLLCIPGTFFLFLSSH